MSEGYSSYLVSLVEEVEREFEREQNGTEVPYLVDGYRNWMLKFDNKKPGVVNLYIHYLKAADKELFSVEDDFFQLLKIDLTNGAFNEVSELFDKYIDIIDEELKLSKKEDVGISSKALSDWKSAYKNYKKFFVEWLIPTMKRNMGKDDNEQDVRIVPSSAKALFGENLFLNWMQDEENMGLHSAQSYVSRVRTINRNLFCQNEKEIDYLAVIPGLLHDNKEIQAIDLLFKLEKILTNRILAKDESLMPLASLTNCRAAFRKYIRFIQDEIIQNTEDEEELEEMTNEDAEIVDPVSEESDVAVYEYDDLETSFRFRLLTQNRMGENKDIFYPIGILRRLFHLSQKLSQKGDRNSNNGNYRWFNRWLDDSIAEITVLTDKGDYILADIDALEINSQSKEIIVTLLDGQKATVWTETETGDKQPMSVNKLLEIHIDHTPLISRILSDNISQLPALARITQIIREESKKNKILIQSKNFSKIGRSLFLNHVLFVELEKLIPALKEELNLIREKSTLKLMSAEYNLRKKK